MACTQSIVLTCKLKTKIDSNDWNQISEEGWRGNFVLFFYVISFLANGWERTRWASGIPLATNTQIIRAAILRIKPFLSFLPFVTEIHPSEVSRPHIALLSTTLAFPSTELILSEFGTLVNRNDIVSIGCLIYKRFLECSPFIWWIYIRCFLLFSFYSCRVCLFLKK